ncbi:MAG TPA: sigma-54 dependent transcriptional regulator [bacterium]|mgnify:FL=1|nr:sigma-54 dependent transcriptional regulator [bacterium]HQQ00240.1 sigma-54 dependent transcriptional regulator [bacterium]
MATILVVDDEARMRKVISLALAEDGHEVLEAENAAQALEIIRSTALSLVVTDLRMPGGDGTEVLKGARATSLHLPVIILTAYGTVENAVQALKEGAHDYLLKPCDLDELKLSVKKALWVQQITLENRYLREQLSGKSGYGELVGRSPKMVQVFELIARVAQGDSTVLIRGESGTGKELVARAIHRDSPRREHPFVAVNCMALPSDLLENELFGHVRGAYTGAVSTSVGKFELADGGTLFLDEIGDMQPRMQGKILRAIQEKVIEPVGGNRSKRVDVRIVAATNSDLEDKVQKGEMRADLYYRLNVVPIAVPPLRERKEDIPLLVDHFLAKKSNGRPTLKFGPEDMTLLSRYHWPGNVRELENLVERAVVLGTANVTHLMPAIAFGTGVPQGPPAPHPFHDLVDLVYKDAKRMVIDEFDKYYFSQILRRTKGNVSQAADLIQIHRKNLHMKLSDLDLDPKQFTTPE